MHIKVTNTNDPQNVKFYELVGENCLGKKSQFFRHLSLQQHFLTKYFTRKTHFSKQVKVELHVNF